MTAGTPGSRRAREVGSTRWSAHLHAPTSAAQGIQRRVRIPPDGCRGPAALANEACVTEDGPHPAAEVMPSPPGPSHVHPHRPCPGRALRIGRQRSFTDNKGRCVFPPSSTIAPYGAVGGSFPSSRQLVAMVRASRTRPAPQVDEADSYCEAEGVAGMGAASLGGAHGRCSVLARSRPGDHAGAAGCLGRGPPSASHGHHVRHGSDILSETWEHGRDADMSGNAFYLGQDLSWTSRSRHTKAAPRGWPVGDHPTR
jgi:hypothetical protein